MILVISKIIDKYIFRIYNAERCFFENLRKNNINIQEAQITHILIRKNTYESYSMLYNKSIYEM